MTRAERFAALAEDWAGRIDDGYYAFNDAHAMMALLGAGGRATPGGSSTSSSATPATRGRTAG